jgi:hypothetical protein
MMATLGLATVLVAPASCANDQVSKETVSTSRALILQCSNGPGESNVRTFETNSLEGVELYRPEGPLDFSPVLTKPLEVRALGAGRALAADVRLGGTERLNGSIPGTVMWLRVPICKPGGTIDLRGKKVTIKVFLDGPALTTPPARFWAGTLLPQGWGAIAERAGVPVGSEETISGQIPSTDGAAKVDHLIVSVAMGGANGPTGWSGSVLIDEIQIE